MSDVTHPPGPPSEVEREGTTGTGRSPDVPPQDVPELPTRSGFRCGVQGRRATVMISGLVAVTGLRSQ